MHVRWFPLLWLCAFLWPAQGLAQRAVRLSPGTVAEQLDDFRSQTGWNLIYARSVVEGLDAACQYVGTNYEEALNCILRDSGIGWRKTRDRQDRKSVV